MSRHHTFLVKERKHLSLQVTVHSLIIPKMVEFIMRLSIDALKSRHQLMQIKNMY